MASSPSEWISCPTRICLDEHELAVCYPTKTGRSVATRLIAELNVSAKYSHVPEVGVAEETGCQGRLCVTSGSIGYLRV